jgi:ADP-dependent NAD(P)H-hydrate dehydratase / NAD(P)H-hydrate epimerase
MRHVTRAEMREIDRLAIEEHGIPVDTLMENAGRAVADAVEERASKACPVVAVCGKGNNGGDGFVAARLLADRGFEVEILSLQPEYDDSTATGRNWAKVIDRFDFVGRFKRRPMAVILDGIFGTGLSRPVSGREKALILEMNGFDPRWFPIVAIDIPSGLDADRGLPLGAAVQASVTVTMGLPKVGFKNPAAQDYLGELVVADIGFPPALLRA